MPPGQNWHDRQWDYIAAITNSFYVTSSLSVFHSINIWYSWPLKFVLLTRRLPLHRSCLSLILMTHILLFITHFSPLTRLFPIFLSYTCPGITFLTYQKSLCDQINLFLLIYLTYSIFPPEFLILGSFNSGHQFNFVISKCCISLHPVNFYSKVCWPWLIPTPSLKCW